jgi:hypothetical protein
MVKKVYKNKREDIVESIQSIWDNAQYAGRVGAFENQNLVYIQNEINKLFEEYEDGTIQKGEDLLVSASEQLVAGESRTKAAKTLEKSYMSFAQAKQTLRRLTDMLENLTFKIESVKDQILETKTGPEEDLQKH